MCTAGTVPQRNTAPATPNNRLSTPKKAPGKKMHAAFGNAGQTKGLEVWRIEVSNLFLFTPQHNHIYISDLKHLFISFNVSYIKNPIIYEKIIDILSRISKHNKNSFILFLLNK